MRRLAIVSIAGVTGVLAAGTAFAAGQAGDLDPAFGTDGVVNVGNAAMASYSDFARTPDGGLVFQDRDRVVRLLAAGQPDPTFGANGVQPLPAALENPRGVAVDGQGRTVVAGNTFSPSNESTALLRLLPDGTVDTDFGADGDGIARLDLIPGGEDAASVVVDSAGRYVLGGSVASGTDERPQLVRLTTSGKADKAFGGSNTGQLVFDSAAAAGAEFSKLALDGGVIVAAGEQDGSGDERSPIVARVLASTGQPAPGFGADGLDVIGGPTTNYGLGAVIPLPDGRTRVVGNYGGGTPDPSQVRGVIDGVTANGTPDTAVSSNGRRVYDVTPGTGSGFSGGVLSGGSLYLTGLANFAIAGGKLSASPLFGRLTVDGAPDPTFSGDGYATLSTGADGRVFVPSGIVADEARNRVVGAGQAVDVATNAVSTRFVAVTATDVPAAPTTTPTPGPVATATPTAGPTATPTPTPTPAARKRPKASSVLRLTTVACGRAGRRVIKLRVVKPTGFTVSKVTVKVGGGKTRSARSGKRLTVRGKAGHKVAVRLSAKLDDGTTLRRTVKVKVCARAKRGR